MAALEKFEAAEANLSKLESLWTEIETLIPRGIVFGTNLEYEDRCRSYTDVLAALPKIDGWKPTAEPDDLDSIAQNRTPMNSANQVHMSSWKPTSKRRRANCGNIVSG